MRTTWKISPGAACSLLALALLVGIPGLAAADQGDAPVETEINVSALGSGMIVQIDPETGKLRQPTPEEAAKLSAAFAAMRKGVNSVAAPARTPVYHSNGMISAELDPALHEHTVVQINADGELVAECIKGEDAASAHATGQATPNQVPTPREEQ